MAPDIELWDGVVRLLVAAVLAGIVGFERELHEQEAGLRTHLLVGVGAALFVLVGNYGWDDLRFGNQAGVVIDPSRVTAYVVTGIGFLGAGAIIKHGVNVRGLTTAASLWVVAAVGAASAAALYGWAVAGTALVLLSLWPLRLVGRLAGWRSSGAQRLEVELEAGGAVGQLVEAIERAGAAVESARVGEEPGARRVSLVLRGRDEKFARLLDVVADVPGVRSASWAG